MADQTAPEAVRPDAGTGFRLEMAVQNALLGYWRHAFGALLAVLGVFFAYGQYSSWQLAGQQAIAAQISDAESELQDKVVDRIDPATRKLMVRSGWSIQGAFQLLQMMKPEQQMEYIVAPGVSRLVGIKDQPPQVEQMLSQSDGLDTALFILGEPDEATRADLAAGANRLVAIGATSTGPASAAAYVEAADLYRRVGDSAKRKSALEQAASRGDGAIRHGARLGLAHMASDAGDVDGAIALLKVAETDEDPFLAQDAAIQLGKALEFAGRKDEAIAEYAAFITKWPDVPLAVEVKARQTRLGVVPAAPAEAPAPTPGTPVEPEKGG